MKHSSLLIALALALAAPVRADVYKSTDSSGRTVFSDHGSGGAEKLDIPPAPPQPAPAGSSDGEEGGAQQAPENQAELQRKALQEQLDAESARLAEARAALRKAQDLIQSDERNSQDDIDRTARLEDEIARHEKKVEDLRKKISVLK